MKQVMLILLMAVFCLNSIASEGRFFTYPDVFEDKVVFSFEGDIWLVKNSGGTASRLTSFFGNESNPKFSPDGKSIAFTGQYDGTTAAYIMPVGGGEPRRLTYNPGRATVLGFTPDGRKVFFNSYLETYISRDPNLYSVNVNGGEFRRFPTERGVQGSFDNSGMKLLYVRKGKPEYQWKRYKGGQYTDIWSYNYKTKEFNPITSYVGKNAYPMWIKDKMMFVSDRGNGISNLYLMNLNTKIANPITNYENYDVMFAETDGKSVVFVQNGYIKFLDINTSKVKTLKILIPTDRWRLRTRVINPEKYIHSFDIDSSGRFSVIEARGDIFTINTKTGVSCNITNTPGIREMYPVISPNGKQIAFFSDKSEEYQLYTMDIDGKNLNKLTKILNKTNYHVKWSPDGKKLLFGNKDFSIFYFDLENKKLVKVDSFNQLKNDEFFWEISDYDWSPDSKWICYSTVAYNKNSVIKLFSLKSGKIISLTDDFYDNLNPCFDKDGEYLYYMSSRNFDIQMDFYEDNHIVKTPYNIMVVSLKSGKHPPFIKNEKIKLSNKKVDKKSDFRIDLKGLSLRTYRVPVKAGNYFYLKAGKSIVLMSSKKEFNENSYDTLLKPGRRTYTTLHLFSMKNKKEVKVKTRVNKYLVSINGKQIIYKTKKGIFCSSIDSLVKNKETKNSISTKNLVYTVNTEKEFNQIFSDCWRWYRDFFYDKNMHGQNWVKVGERYRAFIPYLSSRAELNWLMSQMVGEISVGHAYIWGGDNNNIQTNKENIRVFTGLLGVDFTPDIKANRFRFSKIYRKTKHKLDLKAPLDRPDFDIKEGDYLIAINGKNITIKDDYFKYLRISKGQKIKLTVSSDKEGRRKKTYNIEPVRSDRNLRYNNWLTNNIDYVLKKTNGKVGYMHINNMSSRGIAEFDKFFRAFRYKQGIIIDVRRNGGGWTEYFLIDKLERKQIAYNVLKGMKPHRYPGTASRAKYVAVSNEDNGSDGEAFIEHFKARNLGKVVGVPSWGGLVGIINGQATIDNGMVHQPNNSFYGKERKWWVENHGADPDITVDNDPESVSNGIDKQLDKAIEVVLSEIKNDKTKKLPPIPAYPDKTKKIRKK